MQNINSLGGNVSSVVVSDISNIPQSTTDFEDIKARVSILDVIAYYGMVPDKAGKIHSIFTDSDSTPSLHIYPDTNSFYCFSQQKGGSSIDFIMAVESVTAKEAIQRLAEIGGLPNPIKDGSQPIKPRKSGKQAKPAVVLTEVARELPEALTTHQIEIPDPRTWEDPQFTYTTYHYSEHQKIVRKQNKATGKKYFPCYFLKDGEWINEKGDSLWYPFPMAVLPTTKIVVIAEGEKDTLSLLSRGIPALTPPGHSWLPKYYSQMAGMLADKGITHCFIWPDFDKAGDKKKVSIAQSLREAGIFCCVGDPEEIFSGMTLGDGFGATDYFDGGGTVEKILELVNGSTYYAFGKAQEATQEATPEAQATPGNPQEGKQPIQDIDIILDAFKAEYQDNLIYYPGQKSFFLYQDNHWQKQEDDSILGLLRTFLRQQNYLIQVNRLKDMLLLLRIDLRGELDTNNKYLPFLDGCLNLESFRFVPHSSNIGNLFILPRNYLCNVSQTPMINGFLEQLTNNNREAIAQIEAFMAAVLRRMSNCQKFLHLLGSAGSGKGTFLRLLSALVGPSNTHSSSLGVLENSNFESFNLVNKLVTIFPDEHRIGGNLSRFLALTGGDMIRCEEKYREAFSAPYRGMVALASNLEVFVSDAMDAVARRRILITCQHKPQSPDPYLDRKLQAELPALTKRLLALSEDEILHRLRLRSHSREVWESRVNSNSVAAWMNEYVVFDPTHKAVVGRSKDEGLGDVTPVTLFASYNKFCRDAGYIARSLNNFSADVILTAKTFFSEEIKKGRTMSGRYLLGLRLRMPDEAYLEDMTTHMTANDNLHDNLKALPNKDYDNHDNLKEKVDYKGCAPNSYPDAQEATPEGITPHINEEKKFSSQVVMVDITQSQQGLEVVMPADIGCHVGCHAEAKAPLTIDDIKVGESYLYLVPGRYYLQTCKCTAKRTDNSGYPVIEIQFDNGTITNPYPEQLGRV